MPMQPEVIAQLMSARFAHIPTNELALLLRYAESSGYADAPHATAYRAELARRGAK